MKTVYINIKKIAYVFIVLLLCVITVIAGGVNSSSAFAAETTYSDVLEDLQKDSSFSESDYPVNKSIISLSVISLAESENDELLVYVYNPQSNSEYNATYLRFFTTTASHDYSLTLLSESESGTLQKYLVDGYEVTSGTTRDYSITCIFRRWISGVDGEASDDETINHITQVPFAVAKTYTFTSLEDGSTDYSISVSDVATIETKYLGYISYNTAINGVYCPTFDYTDSHFVAFSTDYEIDDLYEIDVVFATRSVNHYTTGVVLGSKNVYTYGSESDPTYLTITSTDTVVTGADFEYYGFSVNAAHLNDRIEKAEDFFADENNAGYKLEDDTEATISGCQYVVRYLETEREVSLTDYTTSYDYYQVTNMSILRLKFRSGIYVYNLGVVDNYQREGNEQEPDETVGGKNGGCQDGFNWQLIIAVLALILVCIILAPILPTVITWIITAVIWIVSLPFKLIGKVIKAFKKKE